MVRRGDTDGSERMDRRDRLLAELAQARALGDRVTPRRTRAGRRRAAMRAITFRR